MLLSSHKYGFGIRDPEKTYPGFGPRGPKGIGSRIRHTDRKTNYKCLTYGSLKLVDSLVDGLGHIVQVTRGHLHTVQACSHLLMLAEGEPVRRAMRNNSDRKGGKRKRK